MVSDGTPGPSAPTASGDAILPNGFKLPPGVKPGPDVRPVVRALQNGECACFPTETLWALAAPALEPEAVQRIWDLKQRPQGVPLAVGVHSWRAAQAWIVSTPGADALAAKFLPGPISLVLKARGTELAHVAPGFDTLSIRIPDHEAALRILDAAGPIVMTSANPHGAPDPLSAEQVRSHFPDLAILDAPDVPGTGSTVVDCTGDTPIILREGIIPKEEVEAAWP